MLFTLYGLQPCGCLRPAGCCGSASSWVVTSQFVGVTSHCCGWPRFLRPENLDRCRGVHAQQAGDDGYRNGRSLVCGRPPSSKDREQHSGYYLLIVELSCGKFVSRALENVRDQLELLQNLGAVNF